MSTLLNNGIMGQAVRAGGKASLNMINDENIRRIIAGAVEKIKKEYQPEKIILFGSYAYGTPTKDSDIDLFIVKETEKRRIDRFVEVRELIYDPDIQISIQPLVYSPEEVEKRLAIGDQFVEDVLEKGKLLYAR
jgi:uncharacterized protein